MKYPVVVGVGVFLAACAADPIAEVASDSAALRERVAETTVWVDPVLERDVNEYGAEVFVLSGRASRNITDVRGFVFDDVYGQTSQPSVRTFEVNWTTGEIAGLVDGVNQFIGLSFVPSPTRPEHLTAKVNVQPALHGFSGSGVYLTREVESRGGGVYRVHGEASATIQTAQVNIGTVTFSGKALDVDLTLDQLLSVAGNGEELVFTVKTASGTRTKRAELDLTVASLGLTDGDAYEVWPPGVAVDDTHLVAAFARGDAASAAIRPDADALVGASRAVAFEDDVRRTIEHRLEQTFGQRFDSVAAMTAEHDKIIAWVIDGAYTWPLEHVEELTPAPGDAIAARDVAADALLKYLTTIDLTNTEFGRPLEVMTKLYRAQYIADLREWRTLSEPYNLNNPTEFTLLGSWLGAYVEIGVSRTTGLALGVYFEID